MNDKLKATSHAKKSARAGPPVLIVLDPGASTYTIDFSKEEDVKLWVINRLPIYYSEEGKNWEHGYCDFEGCLTKPKIIIKDGKKYQEHLTLPQKPHHIHFTSVLPAEADKQKRFETFGIKNVNVEAPRKDIVRPYPEGFPNNQRTFDFGIFKDGIEIVKIPASSVIYVSGKSKLRYWESLLYKNSRGGIYGKLKNKEAAGDPWSSQDVEDLKKALDGKRGIPRAILKKKEEANVLDSEIVGMNPDREDELFAFGMSKDIARSEGRGLPLALKEEEPKESEDLGAQIHLFKISPFTKVRPTQDFYRTFITNDLGKMIQQFGTTDPGVTDESLLKQITDHINGLGGLSTEDKKELAQQFHICTEDSELKCLMLGVSNAIENWRFSISTYHSDLVSSKKFRSSCIISVKPFYFATGSDAYSNEIVPKHVFYQIKEWWDDQLYDYQRKEIAEEVAEIEVIGYSSKKTRDESDNRRLRDDRAWKTAKCLELVIKNALKNRTTKIVPCLASSEQFKRIGVSPKPVVVAEKLPIFYVGEGDLAIYPNRSIFRLEGNYVMDLVLDTQVSVKEPLKASTDDPEDRACLVIFKRAIPDEVNQIIKSVVITNNASPIFTYRKILSQEMGGGKIRVVVFVCPGEFAN